MHSISITVGGFVGETHRSTFRVDSLALENKSTYECMLICINRKRLWVAEPLYKGLLDGSFADAVVYGCDGMWSGTKRIHHISRGIAVEMKYGWRWNMIILAKRKISQLVVQELNFSL
jgi:hypothetical protein